MHEAVTLSRGRERERERERERKRESESERQRPRETKFHFIPDPRDQPFRDGRSSYETRYELLKLRHVCD